MYGVRCPERLLLLGRLALYSGMISRQVNWKIVNFAEIVLDVKANRMINVSEEGALGEKGSPEA